MHSLLPRDLGTLILAFWCLLPTDTTAQLTDTTRVAIHDLGNYYEIENGYLGVRLPKSSLFNVNAPKYVPAPLNAVVYQNGVVSSSGANYLVSTTPALTMFDSILYQTTDSCAILIRYTFDKPPLMGFAGQIEPAGPGYYHVTVRMIKGEKVAIVTEESDFEVGYEMKISNGLNPNRGRYQGHQSSSIADGYDVDSNQYIRGSNVGWNATVNLQYAQRKNFEMLSRWNPWVWNSGWHWTVYNSTAPDTAALFGMFDGRPSLLLGVAASGVGLYTDPGGARDMHAACDTLGNCHYVWRGDTKLWYKKINADGTSTTEEIVSNSLTNPFIFIEDNTVNILAIDPIAAASSQVKLLKKIGTGSFVTHTLNLDASLLDPVAYGASNGTHDFLMIYGNRNGQQGLHLYYADFNSTAFTYSEMLNTTTFNPRSGNRPDMRKAKNGNIVVAYTYNGFYQSYNVILKDSTHFQLAIPPNPLGVNVTYGMAIDPVTGDFFYVRSDLSVNYVDLEGVNVANTYSTGLGAYINLGDADTLNRRSLATDPNGNALAYHAGFFYWFNGTTHDWMTFNGSAWQGIIPCHVHYNPTDSKFYIVGQYQGLLKRWSYTAGTDEPVLVETFTSTALPEAGVRVAHYRLSPSQAYFPDIRFQWCIFAGKKGQDLAPANQVQPIAKVLNRISGLAKKVPGYENDTLTFNPSFANGGIYIPPASVQAIIQKVKTDNSFYTKMIGIDPYYKDVMDAWRDGTGAVANTVWQSIINFSNDLKDALINKDGIFSFNHFYVTGGNSMRHYTLLASGLLADPNIASKLTQVKRDSLVKTAALFARIIWDDDFLPLFTEHGLNLGTPNQPQTYSGFRWFFALMLDDAPEFTARAATVPGKLQTGIAAEINKYGAARGTPHYLQPPADLFIFTALQLKNEGIQNKFTSSDTLKWFSEFLLHLRTPKSVRFANQRKLICFGDGSEESAVIFGLLGTGFAGVDNLLSKRLMYAYRNGPPRSSDFGVITLAVNHDLSDTSLIHIGSGHFPGYLTTMRSGVNTSLENALFFINGDWYSDHRNDDRGAMSIYALGAPLSLNYGAFFYPWVPGAHMKSTVVPESQFPGWNQSYQPFILPDNQTWYSSNHQAYLAFKNSAFSKAIFTRTATWTRSAYQFHARSDTPVFVIKDELSDTGSNHIWNFNFMANGTVETPGGPVTPPVSMGNANPIASPEITLPAAAMNKFTFNGISWVTHPTGGIDWEVYLPASDERKATLTEWGHTFAPLYEATEYFATNNASFQERQTILRVQGKESFFSVIVPYGKGQRPANLNVTKTGNVLHITCDSFTFETDLNYAIYMDTLKKILTTFTSQYLLSGDASIEDGPMELEIRADTIIARLHGQTGARKVKLPQAYWALTKLTPNASYNAVTGKWTLNHTFSDSLHNSYSGGYTEYVFVKAVRVAPKIFLQGPYNTGTMNMNDNLRSGGYLPLSEPYTGLNFTQVGGGGGESTWQAVFNTTGNNAIVDWVFVELRSKSDPATKIATRCALVQRDGDVVDTDGSSPLNFLGLSADSFYVAVRHRNHLGCRTADKYLLNGDSTLTIDFTTNLAVAYKPAGHPNEAMASLGGGKYGLWGGNANGDNFVKMTGPFPSNNDYLKLLNVLGGSLNSILGTYSEQDINMDGNVRMIGPFPSNNDYLKLLNVLGGSLNTIIQVL